jgi:hypothetical protein
MKTDFETLKALSSYTINHLKEKGMIDFDVTLRLELIEALAVEYNVSFATDEDIKDQAVEEVEDKYGSENIPDNLTESEMYNHARKEIIKSFNGENISGLYLVESLHDTAKRVNNFLNESDIIEDVFGTDEEVIQYLVPMIRAFSLKRG